MIGTAGITTAADREATLITSTNAERFDIDPALVTVVIAVAIGTSDLHKIH